MKKNLFILVLLLLVCNLFGSNIPVFTGTPQKKIITIDGNSEEQKLKYEDKIKNVCEIVEIDGKYYWKTRNNVEMTKHYSGAFIIFEAKGGVGYVKVVMSQDLKKALKLKYDYIEHVHQYLNTITYYGNSFYND